MVLSHTAAACQLGDAEQYLICSQHDFNSEGCSKPTCLRDPSDNRSTITTPTCNKLNLAGGFTPRVNKTGMTCCNKCSDASMYKTQCGHKEGI